MLGPNKINAHLVKTLKERAACHSHELHIKCAKREGRMRGSNWVNFGRPWRPMAATCSQLSLVKLTELSFYLGPKTTHHDDRHKWRETFKTRQIPLKAFEISSTISVQWRDPSIQSAEKRCLFNVWRVSHLHVTRIVQWHDPLNYLIIKANTMKHRLKLQDKVTVAIFIKCPLSCHCGLTYCRYTFSINFLN